MGETRQDDTGFAGRLKLLRAEAGLTLAQLADRAGMHLFGVAKLEAGQRVPSWATVLKLADALGVDVSEFRKPATTRAKSPGRGRPAKNRKGVRRGR